MIKHKIGNRKVFDYHLKIDGCPLSETSEYALSGVTAGAWMIKKKPKDTNDDALVRIVYNILTPEPIFQLNTPDVGWVRVILNSSATEGLDPVRAYFALQLEWGTDNKLEFCVGDGRIELCQDLIR